MKTYFYLLVFLCCLTSCKKDEQLVTAPFEQTVTLGFKQSVTLSGREFPELIVTILDVDDSRCPTDVICTWGGLVQTTFGIKDQSGNTQTLTLRDGPAHSAEAQVNGGRYVFTVLEVTPKPTRASNDKQAKQVVFVVKRQ